MKKNKKNNFNKNMISKTFNISQINVRTEPCRDVINIIINE